MNDFRYGRWPRSSDDVIPTNGGAMNTHAESRLPLQGLLVIQILIGYEWLMSGLTVAMWLFRWQSLSLRVRSVVLLGTAVAAVGGVLMNINFHLANGSPHPWLIPSCGFDEGVDLDSLMPATQIVLIAVSIGVWLAMRHTAVARPPQATPPHRAARALGVRHSSHGPEASRRPGHLH